MNLAIPPRKPIRVSDRAGFEPDPLRPVKGSALRDPFVGGSGKLLALKLNAAKVQQICTGNHAKQGEMLAEQDAVLPGFQGTCAKFFISSSLT